MLVLAFAMLPLAEVVTIVAVVAVGLALILAGVALSQKPKGFTDGVKDDHPTTIATRGAFLPLIIGRRRTGYIFVWAGKRFTYTISQGGGGGKRSPRQTSTAYKESGVHGIAVGPIKKIVQIYANKKPILAAAINSTANPSGSSVTTSTGQNFRIFWGELGQPVDSDVAAALGVASSWPGICYIYWDAFNLGGNATWPQIEYLVEGECDSALTLSDTYMGTEGSVNPAHALYQLLFSPFPRGIGQNPADYDGLETIGQLAETEDLKSDILVEGGADFVATLQGFLADIGVLMPQIGSKATFVPLRAAAALAVTDDDIAAPDVEVELDSPARYIDRMIFSFASAGYAYRNYDIKIDNDSLSSDLERYNSRNYPITITTDLTVANRIAARRQQEEFGNAQGIRLTGSRALVGVSVGSTISTPDNGILRIVSTQRSTNSAKIDIDCVPDTFGIPTITLPQTNPPTVVERQPANDLAVNWLTLPPAVTGEAVPKMTVYRIRANQTIAGAVIHVSANSGDYIEIGAQDAPSAGGKLLSSMSDTETLSNYTIPPIDPNAPSTTVQAVESGPVFEDANLDVTQVLNLSAPSSLNMWASGRQLCLIDGEIFYLRNVEAQASPSPWAASSAYTVGQYVRPTTAPAGIRYRCMVAGTSGATQPTFPQTIGDQVSDNGITWEARGLAYRLKGLIRSPAIYGVNSEIQVHNVGTYCFIADATTQRHLYNNQLTLEQAYICTKTQPWNLLGYVPLSGVSAICHVFTTAVISYLTDESDLALVDESLNRLETA